MASDHLLYLLYRLRVPRDNVESDTPTYVGCGLRFRLGPRFDRASSDNLVGRNDGMSIHHGSCRNRLWSWCPILTLVLLFEARTWAKMWTIFVSRSVGHLCLQTRSEPCTNSICLPLGWQILSQAHWHTVSRVVTPEWQNGEFYFWWRDYRQW